MSTMHARRRLQTGVATLGAIALLASTGASPVAAKTDPVRKPAVANLANPGVVRESANGLWVIHGTGSWTSHPISVSKTTSPSSFHKISKQPLLTGAVPDWMGAMSKGKRDKSIWAPSVIQGGNGLYVAYFAVTVRHHGAARCIGMGTSAYSVGPFTPQDKALACFKGSGVNAHDNPKSEGKGFSFIDPTPVILGSEMVLTYKTQIKNGSKWHTTTRLLKLDLTDPTKVVGNPAHNSGASIKIANSSSKYIEENPNLALHGGTYTLFTSFGFYGTCDYVTRYHRVNGSSLWKGKTWLDANPHNLPFPKNTNTCGRGNAQVSNVGGDLWRIYFNGHASRSKTPGGPKNLYVGNVTWKKGKPYVSKIR
ncbi:MAG: arabinan endo,5-alpha-L-arabinosidase [Nocardioidaceae bacterium]|nr:arabinan endo,5-alpha-L-arabinosidase [Nocardioidaceae bacterium]